MSKTNGKVKEPLLDIKGLKTHFFTEEGVVQAVDGVDFEIYPGETLAVVGESGCGKSVTALSIIRLVSVPGEIVGGTILFQGRDLVQFDQTDMVEIRGNAISMIFQQPASALNPVFRIGYQVSEVLMTHNNISQGEAWKQAIELLRKVGIPDPESRANAFPHQISGGQAQRVMIAMMLANMPSLLIADEPTTALDVTIQAQILDLMRDLRDEFGTAIMLITHDMGVVAEMADRVAVMYAGQVVEYTDVYSLFDEPQHPYTQGLLASIPVLGSAKNAELSSIPGSVPNLINLPPGCRFAPRCKARIERNLTRCTEELPPLITVKPNHLARCWIYEDRLS
ncbi:MAG: ABC transporter ATP-binding protein [Ardenticatenaceae bacterium]